MLKTFALVITLWQPGVAPETYVVDGGISADDCTRWAAMLTVDAAYVLAGQALPGSNSSATIACEVEQ